MSVQPAQVAGRVHNFSAGPARLPRPVLERMQTELLDYAGRGLSVMEMSHRSAAFIDIATAAEADLRTLLAIPDDYAVLFLQGGATLQFTATVLNLAGDDADAPIAVADTGVWSAKALRAAERLRPAVRACALRVDAEGRDVRVPDPAGWAVPDDAPYLHVCDNETIGGVALGDAVLTGIEAAFPGLPIVADMSSSLLSRPLDVSRYALIYAGAQKNIGPAGLTLVIASPEAMARSRAAGDLPDVLSYAAMAAANSMLNTPPTFAWYAAGCVFEWLLDQGGVTAMHERNRHQAARVYDAIDRLGSYDNPVASAHRSIMNLPFTLADSDHTRRFLELADRAHLVGLKGHKSVGGCRASLYNAMDDDGVDALLELLTRFDADVGGMPHSST